MDLTDSIMTDTDIDLGQGEELNIYFKEGSKFMQLTAFEEADAEGEATTHFNLKQAKELRDIVDKFIKMRESQNESI